MRTPNLQLHVQLRTTVQNILNDLMLQNNVSAMDMSEAVEHYLLSLKDAEMAEYVGWAMQEQAKAEAAHQAENSEKEETPQIEVTTEED